MGDDNHVVIGMDPHKRSVTIEVMTNGEQVLGGGRFATDTEGFTSMLAYVAAWPDRVWAIEGCEGIGRHVAQRLIAGGESVLDVPAKLSARVRVFATGQGRKTDDTDAHSIALVGVRMTGLRAVVNDEQLELLRLLVDRRRRLGEDHTRMVCQLHQLLLELIPGGAKRDLSAAQARKLLAGVRPRDVVGKTRKQHAMELVVDLERIYQRKKAANKELIEVIKSTGTGLLDLHGIGPSGAARLLVEIGDITRFPDRGHFASWTGTAPIDASSGDRVRHRLSRGGNRQINVVLHIMATVQLRNPTEGRAITTARSPPGSPPTKPCAPSSDASPTSFTAPCSTTWSRTRRRAREDTGVRHFNPARPAHIPAPALRTSHFPDPPRPSLRPHSTRRLDTEGRQIRARSRAHYAACADVGTDTAVGCGAGSRFIAAQPSEWEEVVNLSTMASSRRSLLVLAVAALSVGLLVFQWGRSQPQVHEARVECLSAPETISCELPDDWTISIPRDVKWTDRHGDFHEDGRPGCLPPTGIGLEGPVRVWWTEVEANGMGWRQVVMVGCEG